NGTIIAETPPALLAIPFTWRDFTLSGRFPAGTSAVTVVFYGDHAGEGRKGLHFDDVLLRVNNECAAPGALSVIGVSPFGIARDATSTITVSGTGFQGTPTVLLRGAGVTVV